jgi:hypothetical protein
VEFPGAKAGGAEIPWQRLDNAAKIFPSTTSDRLTNLFRLSVDLRQPVDPDQLTRAAQAVHGRFPSFQYRLRPGAFWYSLVHDGAPPPVVPDSSSPCMPLARNNGALVRVRWFGTRLAVEFSHSLTDGVGGLVYLRALVAAYHGLADGNADPGAASDDFQTLYDPTFPGYETWDKAFLPSAPLLPQGRYAVTTGRLDADAVLAQARAGGATLTEYLAATLLAAFQDTFEALPSPVRRRRARPVRLVLPVNLRPVFGSKTLRNFFVVVPVEIDLRLGHYEFDEILRKVHHQLQAEMDPKLLKKQIMRNLRGELNPVGRLLPLPLKNVILSSVFGAYERRHTASLSNLGRLAPGPWSDPVVHADFTPPPSPFCRVNAGVVSVHGVLSVTFGNSSVDPSVERAFFTRLRRQGLAVFVESNRGVWED